MAKNLELGIHVDGYGKTIETSYRDYVRPEGDEIYQTLKLDIVPFGLTVRLVPTSKRTKVAPYIGGGIDLFYWKYEEWGDFIDFWDPDLAIYNDAFYSERRGVRVPCHRGGPVLSQPGLRDRGRGAVPVGRGGDGGRFRAQRAGADQSVGSERGHRVPGRAPEVLRAAGAGDGGGVQDGGFLVARPYSRLPGMTAGSAG